MSRGHMWCKANALVAPGDSVYYDTVSGLLGNASGGLMASGWERFSKGMSSQTVYEIFQEISGLTLA